MHCVHWHNGYTSHFVLIVWKVLTGFRGFIAQSAEIAHCHHPLLIKRMGAGPDREFSTCAYFMIQATWSPDEHRAKISLGFPLDGVWCSAQQNWESSDYTFRLSSTYLLIDYRYSEGTKQQQLTVQEVSTYEEATKRTELRSRSLKEVVHTLISLSVTVQCHNYRIDGFRPVFIDLVKEESHLFAINNL